MLQFTKKFPQKRAFVTGAASGLGKAFAILLAQEGWTIGVTDINEKPLEKVKNQIEALGGKAFSYVFDVSDKTAYQKVAEDFLSKNQGIDLLINNAGVGDGGTFHEYEIENWDWMIGINLMGVIYGTHLFYNDFLKQNSGHIINIASAAGFAHAPSMGPYNVSKSGVIAFSKTLYYELGFHEVNISVVMPTFFKTNVMQHARGSEEAKSGAIELINNSKLEPEPVALEILTKAAQGDYEIILPKSARRLYFVKKYFSKYFDKMTFKMMKERLGIK